jgi:hypothetical protein
MVLCAWDLFLGTGLMAFLVKPRRPTLTSSGFRYAEISAPSAGRDAGLKTSNMLW